VARLSILSEWIIKVHMDAKSHISSLLCEIGLY